MKKKEIAQVSCTECLYVNRLITCKQKGSECSACKNICCCKSCDSEHPEKPCLQTDRPGFSAFPNPVLEMNRAALGLAADPGRDEKPKRKRTSKSVLKDPENKTESKQKKETAGKISDKAAAKQPLKKTSDKVPAKQPSKSKKPEKKSPASSAKKKNAELSAASVRDVLMQEEVGKRGIIPGQMAFVFD